MRYLKCIFKGGGGFREQSCPFNSKKNHDRYGQSKDGLAVVRKTKKNPHFFCGPWFEFASVCKCSLRALVVLLYL